MSSMIEFCCTLSGDENEGVFSMSWTKNVGHEEVGVFVKRALAIGTSDSDCTCADKAVAFSIVLRAVPVRRWPHNSAVSSTAGTTKMITARWEGRDYCPPFVRVA